MKLFFRFLPVVTLVILFCSCTKTVYIGRRTDPEISLSKEHHNLIFINLFDYNSSDLVKERERFVYSDGIKGLIDGLAAFSNDTSFTFSVGMAVKKWNSKENMTTLLPADSITDFCARHNANLLLTLDSISIYFSTDTVSGNIYGGKSGKMIDFYLTANSFLSLYKNDGTLIDRSEADQSLFFRSRTFIPGITYSLPSVAGLRDEAASLAFQAGQDYVAKYYPEFSQETEKLFTGKAFKESNRYVFARDWLKAEQLLEELMMSSDAGIAARARHNLEVVQSAAGADKMKLLTYPKK
jgi:hypothetical protein